MPSISVSMKLSATCGIDSLPLSLYQRGTQFRAPNSSAENIPGSQGRTLPSAMPSVTRARTVLSSRRWNWRMSPSLPLLISRGRWPTSTRQRPKSLFCATARLRTKSRRRCSTGTLRSRVFSITLSRSLNESIWHW